MEVSFAKEARMLRKGAGEVFHGEGILAITKALLQSGVAYVGGYQGAPVSHLLDVLVQSKDYLAELGVHVEPCANEASAAAMLGASIHYPLRGAVTWKSIVGTNVAADALSNLSSPGVKGGALIIVGEDYGEGASVIQERTYAFALKSSLLLLDPRPELAHMVRIVEHAFALSEASSMPAVLTLRIRACHVRGTFECRDNVAPAVSTRHLLDDPAAFDYGKLAHPPVTFAQEKRKSGERIPAARRYIVDHALNERIGGTRGDVGIVVQGGLFNSLVRAAAQFGLADVLGECALSTLVLNVVYPLVPEEIADFCRGKRAVLVVEEGQPEFIEQDIAATLRRAGVSTPLCGKDMLPHAGEYTVEVIARGLAAFLAKHAPEIALDDGNAWLAATARRRDDAAEGAGRPLARAAAAVLHRLSRAARFCGAEARAAGHRAGARCRRHRMPRVRDLRAVLDGPLDPRLRHEPCEPRGRVADDEAPHARRDGRRRLLAQRPPDRRAVGALQRRRRGAAHHEERLHVGHGHAGDHFDTRGG